MCLNCRCQNCHDGDCDKHHEAHDAIRRVKSGEKTREWAIGRIARYYYDGDEDAAKVYFDEKYNWVKDLGPLFKDDMGGTR